MDRQWIYLSNPFESATNDSYRAMKKIGDYTVLALAGHLSDPQIALVYSGILPLNNTYKTAYDAWIGQSGTQKSKTSSLTATFKEIGGLKIGRWDIAVQNVYPEGTEQYNNLFPQHRRPFQQGSQEDRLTALNTLNTKVAADAALPTSLKDDIAAVLAAVNSQFNTQKTAISSTKGLSDDVEAKRLALCVGMYSGLGLLMSHFCNTPQQVAQFFDLETIRNHEQSIFRNSVAKGGSRLVMTHTFAEGEDVKLINDGPVALKFYLAAEANDPLPPTAVTVAAGESVIKDASELGDIHNRYLIASNGDALNDGHYTVVLI